MSQPEIVCPAGHFHVDPERGPGVECGVERQFIPYLENPKTCEFWCCRHYTKCPSWIASKEDPDQVAAAHGAPKMLPCDACNGSGIWKVEKVGVGGLTYVGEDPCEPCGGTGRMAKTREGVL